MSFLKRAYLHTIRKKYSTVIMFCILLAAATLILTCISINSATAAAALNIRKSFAGSFTINARQTDGQLDDEIVSDILSLEGMTSKYNLRSYYYAEYKNSAGAVLEITTDGAFDNIEGYESAGKVVSNSYSVSDTYFTEAGFELISGRHIESSDHMLIIVSQNFAQQNDLVVGDTVILNGIAGIGNEQEVEIIGLFEPTVSLEADVAPSYDIYDNVTFTDNETYSKLYYGDGSNHYQYGDFYIEDPEEMDQLIQKVEETAGINWDQCIIARNDVEYQKAKSDLESLQNLAIVIIAAVIALSVVLLFLVLTLWIRNRLHETGVLLAAGIGKEKILLQYIAETMMTAIISFTVSYGTSSLIGQHICDNLLMRAAVENTITDIKMAVSLPDLLSVYIIGTAVILIAVIAASYPIMRMKPKEVIQKSS